MWGVARSGWVVAVAVLTGGCFLFPQDDGLDNTGPASQGEAVDDPSIPDLAYCDDVATWPEGSIDFEETVLDLTNTARAEGGSCGGQSFGPAPALTMNGGLRCAARVQSLDMDVRQFFDHINPSGEGPDTRVTAAGFQWMVVGENIAFGQRNPSEVIQGWLASPGHCANIMDPRFTHLGVGVHQSEGGIFWTQAFGTPL